MNETLLDKYGLPVPTIKLDGFPVCAHPRNDGREVEKRGDFCAQDGGKPASTEILRRVTVRQIRSSIRQMMLCGDCVGIPLTSVRCPACTWLRGAAMGIAGVGEQMGFAEDLEPLMALIGVFDPGWQERCQK